ncbi:Z-ring associated ZapG family protein [Marinomonas epiphytica]
MITEEFNIIIFVTGIIIGCIATFAFKSLSSKGNHTASSPSAASAASVQSLQQELDKNQVIIDNFFSDSDQQLQAAEKRLTELRQNLSSGAKQLSNISISAPQTANPDAEPSPESEVTAPPRDYAIKSETDEGMLSEKFGLPKDNETIEPNRTI